MRPPRRARPIRSLAALLTVCLIGWLLERGGVGTGEDPAGAPPPSIGSEVARPGGSPAPDSGAARIARAFAARESGFMVRVEADVVKLLSDDLDGSRHQRFLIRLDDGRSLLVAHNIDLAPRAPVEPGDRIRLRGQYEWNDRGGLLHWTHVAPDGDHPGGWIEVDGQRLD